MISFYPGPSKLDKRIPQWLNEGIEHGMISANHRSEKFISQYQEIIDLFQVIFKMPKDFEVYFLSSATECWEVLAQSFSQKKFNHFSNGAFGEKWFISNKSLGNNCVHTQFGLNEIPDLSKIDSTDEILCFTHNETSNGTKLPLDFLGDLQIKSKNQLVFMDATSSMAGVMLPWNVADIWFASVQKCFGLPSGMALMFCNKKAIEESEEGNFYNQIKSIHKQFLKRQTTHTPNTLNIYLLWQLLKNHTSLENTSNNIIERALKLYDVFENSLSINSLCGNSEVKSDTVLAFQFDEIKLSELFQYLDGKNIVIGKGYGEWKSNTFRIANFPAITNSEFDFLIKEIKSWQWKQ